MAIYKNVVVDVEPLEPGKFYRVYVDSNGTSLLLPKDTEVSPEELDVISTEITAQSERLNILEKGPEQGQPVTINFNNSNTPNTAEVIKKVVFRGEANIKLAELSVNAVIIDYCLFAGANVEAGRITILDTNPAMVDVDRAFNSQLLPVLFSANRDDDYLNLKLVLDSPNSYVFKYKLTVF